MVSMEAAPEWPKLAPGLWTSKNIQTSELEKMNGPWEAMGTYMHDCLVQMQERCFAGATQLFRHSLIVVNEGGSWME